jgi:hypothetical protein
MNETFCISVLIFSMCSASSQNEPFNRYLNSFKETSKQRLGNFRVLLNAGENMTKEQALQFVYENDSTRLYCHFQEFNMETEKRGAFTTELYLPQKCVKLTTSKFILIGYSTFRCEDPNKLLKLFLTLKIVDSRSLKITDSLVVYRGNEYDWEMTGLINPQKNKILQLNSLVKESLMVRHLSTKSMTL